MENVELKSQNKPRIINEFFYQIENRIRLPVDFAQKIIELENEVNRAYYSNEHIEERVIEELAWLYKTGTEYYSGGLSASKHSHFYMKLQNLLTDKKIIKAFDDKLNSTRNDSIVSNFNNLMNNAKRKSSDKTIDKRVLSNKFSLFINNLKSKSESNEHIKFFDINFNKGLSMVDRDIEIQQKHFKSNRRLKLKKGSSKNSINSNINAKKNEKGLSIIPMGWTKKINGMDSQISPKNYIVNSSDKFYLILQNFIKDFTYNYFNKLLEKPLESTIEISKDIYEKKKKKFIEYEDQIKYFKLLILGEESETYIHSLSLIVESLEIEKKSMIFGLNDLERKLISQLELKGAEIQLDKEDNIDLLLTECLNKIINVIK